MLVCRNNPCIIKAYLLISGCLTNLAVAHSKHIMNTESLNYIPQREPFFMIGDVTYAEGNITRTTLDITADNLFVVNGHFTEPGLIENMAQTAGAGTGYRALKDGKPKPMGYIAALKNVNILSLPKVNDRITTEAVFIQNLLNFHLVKGKVMVGDEEVANCEFKIFVTPEGSVRTTKDC